MNTLKDMVTDNKQVTFEKYHDGSLWYITECGFQFPVPINDTGSAVFLKKDKAMLFMRWIRKHIELIDNERIK